MTGNIALNGNYLSGDGDDEGVFVDSSGNVGIGATAPSARLSVAGDINLTAASAYKYNGADVIIASTTLNNYFFGGAGNLTMTGSDNTASGYEALFSNTTGYNNTANGVNALYSNTTGSDNTANGFHAGYDLTTGDDNTFLGHNTGRGITTGSNNTILGANVTGLAAGLANNIILADGAGNQRINVDGSGNVGIGTTTPTSKLTLENLTLDGAGTSGLLQNLVTTNSVDGAVQYGNRFTLNASNTATTTIVGSIVRVADNTTFGNTVRGLEVQTNRGSNTQGENTALSGFARTFGVRGVTSADAGGSFEPAGGFFETEGTTQGNAIRGFSDSITTASLLSLFQSSSTFAGTGLAMNFGNGGGGLL